MNIKNDVSKKDNRKLCKYGSECYQKNPFHLAKFRHPKRSSDEALSGIGKKNKTDESPSKNTNRAESKDKTSDDSRSEDGPSSDMHNISDSSNGEDISEEVPTVSVETSRNVDCEQGNQSLIEIDKLSGSDKDKLRQLYIVEFPDDFFSFYDYCKTVYAKNPKTALRDIGLELVGPYDYLSGNFNSCTRSDIVRHYRYYFDPPEFFTVLKCDNSELHFGYYFDQPDKPPVFVCSNDPSKNCIIKVEGQTIFGAVNSHMNTLLKSCDPFKKLKIQKVQKSISKWAKDNAFSIESNNLAIRERNSKVSSKTFHTAGIVVPYDPKTDVGYRSLAENDATLKDLLLQIKESESDSERNKKWEKIQHVLTYASIAADECDFGTPLELGIDMFCQGHPCFDRSTKQFMSMAYNLLNRSYFADIIDIHLKNRLKGSDLNFVSRKK